MTPEVKHMLGGWRVGHLLLESGLYTDVAGAIDSRDNTTLDVNTPAGLIAGQLVFPSAPEEVGLAAQGGPVLGINLFNVNEVAAYVNNFAEASERITFLSGKGVYFEVNVYETELEGTGAITYAEGDALYVSANGLLTSEDEVFVAATSGVDAIHGAIVAYVIAPPTAESTFMQCVLV